jgi:hypothetical protein
MNEEKETKLWIDKYKIEIVYSAGIIFGITAYTVACKAAGYRMTKPVEFDGDYVYYKTPTGKRFRTEILYTE